MNSALLEPDYVAGLTNNQLFQELASLDAHCGRTFDTVEELEDFAKHYKGHKEFEVKCAIERFCE